MNVGTPAGAAAGTDDVTAPGLVRAEDLSVASIGGFTTVFEVCEIAPHGNAGLGRTLGMLGA